MTTFKEQGKVAEKTCRFCFNDQMTTSLPEAVAEDGKAVLAFLDGHEADLIELTEKLIAIDSQNPPGDIREIIDYIEQFAEDLELQTEVLAREESKPNLLITLPGETATTLLYNGHVDTVPFESDAWTDDPLGERVDGEIYGRGATDMKGAVAAILHTARVYVETGTVPPVTLEFAFVSDEETAGEAGLPALFERDRLHADACLIGEPTCESGSHSVTIANKGSIWLTLEATGTAAHGSRPPLGENAIDRLIEAVTDLRDWLTQVDFDLDEAVIPSSRSRSRSIRHSWITRQRGDSIRHQQSTSEPSTVAAPSIRFPRLRWQNWISD